MPDKTQHEKLEQKKKDGSICGVMEEKCPTRNFSQELQQQQKKPAGCSVHSTVERRHASLDLLLLKPIGTLKQTTTNYSETIPFVCARHFIVEPVNNILSG